MRAQSKNSNSAHLIEQLSYWADFLSQKPPRSLAFLRSIEDRVSMFRRWHGFIERFTDILREEGDKLLAIAPARVLDKDGSAQVALFNAQKAMKDHYLDLKSWCERERPAFDDADEIIDECTKLISAVSELHNYLNALRWEIAQHDGDYAKKTGSFKTVKEVAEHLNSQHS